MSRALIEGLWCFNPSLNTDAAVYITKWLAGCKNFVYYGSDPEAVDIDLDDSRKIIQSYSLYTRWSIYLQITLHTYLVNFVTFRWYFNQRVWLAQKIIYWFPILAIYKFGIKQAYVRILNGVKWSQHTSIVEIERRATFSIRCWEPEECVEIAFKIHCKHTLLFQNLNVNKTYSPLDLIIN